MSCVVEWAKSFIQNNWLVLVILVAAYLFLGRYESTVKDIGRLETTVRQLEAAVEDIEKENAMLRKDVELKLSIGVEHREKANVLENATQVARQVLAQGNKTSSWSADSYPDYVYRVIKLLEQTSIPPGSQNQN